MPSGPIEVPNDPPLARFSTECVHLSCDVDGSASTDDASISTYAWTFGDGTTKQGVTATHTYSDRGTYQIRLDVTDSEGLTSTATRTVSVSSAPPDIAGIWIGWEEISQLPMQGPSWLNVVETADNDCGVPDLSDQDDETNVCILAKALIFARTGSEAHRSAVVSAIEAIGDSGPYDGRALSLGRELGAYVISADLVALREHDPELHARFGNKLRELRLTETEGSAADLIDCHEGLANNWGNHCGASRAAIAAYLEEHEQLDRIAKVFKGFLGDRNSYTGFRFGSLSWQCDRDAPVGVNPSGCLKDGHPVGGVLPDDQRRSGRFRWPPRKENYVYESLQGALVLAVLLHRQGYDVFSWEDQALLRAFQWLHEQADYPAEGDDQWQPHIVNHFYGTDFPANPQSPPGKNMGWTDWTLSR